MAERFNSLSEKHIEFIKKQHLFFVSTAPLEGFINLSPKGMDSFRVINEKKIIWLNLTGSGNETAAHILEDTRMTLMFCSFDKQPLILRLYGEAETVHPRDSKWEQLFTFFPEFIGARQIFEVELDLVQTSCGFAVPEFQLVKERPTLNKWADEKGKEFVEQYWKDKNTRSMNDKSTGILAEEKKS